MRWKWFYNVIQQWFSVNCPIKTVLKMRKDTFASYWLSASGVLVGRMPAQWLVRADWLVCPDVKTNDNACEYYICNMESFFENALFPNQGVIVSIVPFRRSLPYCFGRKDIVFRIRPISTPKTDDSKLLVKFFCPWCMTKSNVLLHWYKLLNIPAKDKWPWYSWHTLWCCKFCLGSLSIYSLAHHVHS